MNKFRIVLNEILVELCFANDMLLTRTLIFYDDN